MGEKGVVEEGGEDKDSKDHLFLEGSWPVRFWSKEWSTEEIEEEWKPRQEVRDGCVVSSRHAEMKGMFCDRTFDGSEQTKRGCLAFWQARITRPFDSPSISSFDVFNT